MGYKSSHTKDNFDYSKEMQSIMKFINRQCSLREKSEPFELSHSGYYSVEKSPFYSVHWTKKYSHKKGLFTDKWVYEKTCDYEEVEKYRKLLSKLPSGITYTEQTHLTPANRYDISDFAKTERYTTVFRIFVSKDYCDTIINTKVKSSVIISEDFDKDLLNMAYNFKQKIITSHSDIIEQIYKKTFGIRDSFEVIDIGFTDYEFGVYLKDLNMKPLESEYQRLGMAIVLVECDKTKLGEKRWLWLIENKNNRITVTRKEKRHSQEKTLSDW